MRFSINQRLVRDSILLTKGYLRIHHTLMMWRKNGITFTVSDAVLSVIFTSFETFEVFAKGPYNGIGLWTIIVGAVNVLIQFILILAVYYVDQFRIKLLVHVEYFIIVNLVVSTSIQMFLVGKIVNWNSFGEKKIMLILLSILLFVLLLLKFFKIKGFHSYLLKEDLSKQKSVIKKVISGGRDPTRGHMETFDDAEMADLDESHNNEFSEDTDNERARENQNL